jgi:hypothetical protein
MYRRPCEWDRRSNPYRPDVPVLLGWFSTADPKRMRVVAPDAQGFFWNLVPGRAYIEQQITPVVIRDCTTRKVTHRDATTQVDWHELPIKADDIARFLPP